MCPADSEAPACVRSGSGPVHLGVIAVLFIILGTHILNQKRQRRPSVIPDNISAFTCHQREGYLRAIEVSLCNIAVLKFVLFHYFKHSSFDETGVGA